MYSLPFLLILTYGPKHENFKADAAALDIDRFAKNGHQMDEIMEKNWVQCQKSKLQPF